MQLGDLVRVFGISADVYGLIVGRNKTKKRWHRKITVLVDGEIFTMAEDHPQVERISN